MKMLQKGAKKSIISICLIFALLITYISGFSVHAEGGTAALTQLRSMSESAYTGAGTSEEPWHIAVAGNESGTNTAFTAPSAFWGDTSSPNGVTDDAVIFERFEGDTTEGKLISSMGFDVGRDGTEVWDGTWNYALRLAPWTGFDTATGDLRLGFCFKGNFQTYFTNWTFKFDAQTLTSELEEEKQVQPGDTISLTYIGAYNESQTSRGTNYVVDYTILDKAAESVVYAVVDDDGYATFSGENMIVYGGNYQVAIVDTDVPVSTVIVSNEGNNKITEKNGTLQMTAAVMPEDATTKDVEWSIVDGKDKATIDANGLLTAVADGSVTVRATSVENESVYGECTIQISGQSEAVTEQKPDTNTKPESGDPTGNGIENITNANNENAANTKTDVKKEQMYETKVAPKTGDDSAIPVMSVILIAAAGAAALIVCKKSCFAK